MLITKCKLSVFCLSVFNKIKHKTNNQTKPQTQPCPSRVFFFSFSMRSLFNLLYFGSKFFLIDNKHTYYTWLLSQHGLSILLKVDLLSSIILRKELNCIKHVTILHFIIHKPGIYSQKGILMLSSNSGLF